VLEIPESGQIVQPGILQQGGKWLIRAHG